MKFILNSFVILFSVIFVWLVILNTNPLRNVKTYRVYYGNSFENIEASFKDYDMMIIESNYFEKEDLNRFREKTSTLYLGYLSVFEIPNWNLNFSNNIIDDNYLKVNNVYAFNSEYKNFIGDIRKYDYRDVLLKEVEKSILAKGFDGVFLDTVDWIDFYLKDDIRLSDDLLEGYLLFLASLKEKYPDIIIVQNRSFRAYEKGATKYIDGVMWENYSANKALKEELNKTMLLIKHQLLNHQQVFVLSHQGSPEDEKLAKKLHWRYYNNTLDSYGQWE